MLLDSFPAPLPASQGVVLAALGLTADGTPRFLAVEVAGMEEEEAWRAFLTRLAAVMTHRPLLFCEPGKPALRRDLRKVYPRTPAQVSVSHSLQSWARQAEGAHRAPWVAEVRRIFAAPDLETAVARFRAWRLRWRHRDHRAVEALEADLAAHLAFYHFPRRLWKKLRTVSAVRKAFLRALQAGILGRPVPDGAEAGAGRGGLVFYRTVNAPEADGAPPTDPRRQGATAPNSPEEGRSPVGATV